MPVRLRIGELARQQNLTIKALAERSGVAYNTAHSLYTGRATRIDLDTLERICAALGVTPGEVFSWSVALERTGHEQTSGEDQRADSARATGTNDQKAAEP